MDIVELLRENADLDAAEHVPAEVVQMQIDAANEIERLRKSLSDSANGDTARLDYLELSSNEMCVKEMEVTVWAGWVDGGSLRDAIDKAMLKTPNAALTGAAKGD
jgi:hypothetical protein